jgi:E3 ubiquitin-protein ligase synoviolin
MVAISFWHYFFTSLTLAIGVVSYACYTREQFYPIILFLVTSKVSFIIAANMILALAFFCGRIGIKTFFGQLRDAELELVYDRAKYSITETCLALTIFRQELSPTVFLFFGVLIFLKIFHWVVRSRLDHMEQVVRITISTHISLTCIVLILLAVDISICYYCVNFSISKGKTVIILFAFEFGVLIITALNNLIRYAIQVIDQRMENGLHYKGLSLMLLDLTCDAIRFCVYVIFFCLVFVYYGLPIHIIRLVE